jgi:PleD family two-component response regulator
METIKILVTDDDSSMLLLETMLLEEEGYEVFQAGSGKECLRAALKYRPDIVLLDVMLPDMTGLEVCRKIKEDGTLRDTFVILVSGILVSSEFQADGLETGADGYIIKPIDNAEFLARVRSVVRIKRTEDALRQKEREQAALISKLHNALAEIKTLKGFLPICVSCKKIRDDQGYWSQLEAYISAHSDAILTHGVCPQCAEDYRAQIKRFKESKENDAAENKKSA